MRTKKENWILVAGGGFNKVYFNPQSRLIFKETLQDTMTTDSPERSARLWNRLNPSLRPKAKIVSIIIDGKPCRGWTCPYIKSKYANQADNNSIDEETEMARDRTTYRIAMLENPALQTEEDALIANELLDIYNRTGRIIIDASIPGNLIVTNDDIVVCVDVGMALDLQIKEDECLHTYARRQSIISDSAWELVHTQTIDKRILEDKAPILPKTLMVTRALLFIRTHRPDILNVDFLKKDTTLVQQLSEAYGRQDQAQALEELEKKQPYNLSSIKNACTKTLQQYIDSRGSINEKGAFRASFITTWFRNAIDVERKVKTTEKLIKEIHQAQSIEEIQKSLNRISQQGTFKEKFWSSFSRCIGLCKVFSESNLSKPPIYTPITKH